MKTYKGFNQNMTCRGFQYKEGEEYKHDTLKDGDFVEDTE